MAQGTAGRGMRRDDCDADFIVAGLLLINLYPFGKEEQEVAFHRNLVTLSKRADEFFWEEIYHISFPLFIGNFGETRLIHKIGEATVAEL